MVSLHTGRFVVVHLYSTFSVDPQNLYQKLRFFAIFEAVGLHFYSKNSEIWREDADPGLAPRSQIL